MVSCFFFQAEDGIRDLVRSRGLGDVYKRQEYEYVPEMILFNKTFQKVYSNRTWGLNQWKIYFSKDLGVVAFRNEQGVLWALDTLSLIHI